MPEPIAPTAPACTHCNTPMPCTCIHCAGACHESRTPEEMCTNCHMCTYSGCCACWECAQCNRMRTGAACRSCNKCTTCCDCTRCASCDRLGSRNRLCNRCVTCDNCCHCGDTGVQFFNSRTIVFHDAKGVCATKCPCKEKLPKSGVNPSARFISAEIEVSTCETGENTGPVVKAYGGAIVHDGSVPTGFEINTAPASGDKFVKQIREICENLKKDRSKVDETCGLHIHVDARDFNYYDIRKLAFLYQKIEPALFDIVAKKRRQSRFCKPCGDTFIRDLAKNIIPKDNEMALKKNMYGDGNANIAYLRQEKYNASRYNALNLHSWVFRGTIECRMHHGTILAEKIINWGVLWAGILDFAFENSEKSIQSLSGTPLEVLTTIAPTDTNREWVESRYQTFNNRSLSEVLEAGE